MSRRAAGKAREEGVAEATATERNAASGDASAIGRREESWVMLLGGSSSDRRLQAARGLRDRIAPQGMDPRPKLHSSVDRGSAPCSSRGL